MAICGLSTVSPFSLRQCVVWDRMGSIYTMYTTTYSMKFHSLSFIFQFLYVKIFQLSRPLIYWIATISRDIFFSMTDILTAGPAPCPVIRLILKSFLLRQFIWNSTFNCFTYAVSLHCRKHQELRLFHLIHSFITFAAKMTRHVTLATRIFRLVIG